MEINVKELQGIPIIERGDNLPEIIARAVKAGDLEIVDNDIICVASKIVSISEGRDVDLRHISPSDIAYSFQKLIPRKDPRIIQLMIDETGDPAGERLDITGSHHIAGWLPNGLRLTSAGIDKINPETVALLPKDSDRSARLIGEKVLKTTGARVGVIITDSEGREDKKGSSQVAIGIYGVPALLSTINTEETLCDMLAASAALVMGQRGTNKPVVLIRGLDYIFDETSSIKDALYQSRP